MGLPRGLLDQLPAGTRENCLSRRGHARRTLLLPGLASREDTSTEGGAMMVEWFRRGSSWCFPPHLARFAIRFKLPPYARFSYLGLRVARTPAQRMVR